MLMSECRKGGLKRPNIIFLNIQKLLSSADPCDITIVVFLRSGLSSLARGFCTRLRFSSEVTGYWEGTLLFVVQRSLQLAVSIRRSLSMVKMQISAGDWRK